MTLYVNGKDGLSLWCDQRRTGGIPYHHLFDVWRPDSAKAGDSIGMFFHHTPVYIGRGYYNWASPFPGFNSYAQQPDIGGMWMLAVDGAALAREFYVSLDWPDYVFDPNYKLMPLAEVESYIKKNHHLPGVSSADSLAKTGVPLGTTEAKLMEKVEEQQLYIIEMNKKLEALEAKVERLERGAK